MFLNESFSYFYNVQYHKLEITISLMFYGINIVHSGHNIKKN